MRLVALIVALALASNTLEANTLKSQIQTRLHQDAVVKTNVGGDCPPNGEDAFCPQAQVPHFVLGESSDGGSGQVEPCSPLDYLHCQAADEEPYCRALLSWEGNQGGEGSADVCLPPLGDNLAECTCQQELQATDPFELRLCPLRKIGCPSCECHGDPHCTSFGNKTETFAVCDDRPNGDGTCQHKGESCHQTMFMGQQCQWNAPINGGPNKRPGFCGPHNDEWPTMLMYSKEFKSYTNYSDQTMYSATVQLSLGWYGSTNTIQINDGGVEYEFNDECKQGKGPNAPGDATKGFKVLTENSQIELLLTCAKVNKEARWTVEYLMDPWYRKTEDFGGFCATGEMKEIANEDPWVRCQDVEMSLNKHHCGQPMMQETQECIEKFSYQYRKSVNVNDKQFKKWLMPDDWEDPNRFDNWVLVTCALFDHTVKNKIQPKPLDLETLHLCDREDDIWCQPMWDCFDDIYDYPEEIKYTLENKGGGIGVKVLDPLPDCGSPQDLVTTGLQRAAEGPVPDEFTGLKIVRVDENTQEETLMFALFESEYLCKQMCDTVLVFTAEQRLPFTLKGFKYEMRQCEGIGGVQQTCESTPGLNGTVSFPGSDTQNFEVSLPMGGLYNSGDLVCNPDTPAHQNCPAEYRCCIFPERGLGWSTCMDTHHGGADLFPDCQK